MDIVRGKAVRVIDGDTFELEIDREGLKNGHDYNDVERCRLKYVDAPEITTSKGPEAKKRLERRILGKTIWLDVHAREKRYRRLIVAFQQKVKSRD